MQGNVSKNSDCEGGGKMYRCHFCNLNIERYDIENHFDKFHKFRSPSPEHVCGFCEDEVFNSKNDLLKHNKYVHDYDEEMQMYFAEARVETFEEGKSKFVQFMTNFNSEDDAFSLLNWIKNSITLENLRLIFQDDERNNSNTDGNTKMLLTNEEIESEFLNNINVDEKENPSQQEAFEKLMWKL